MERGYNEALAEERGELTVLISRQWRNVKERIAASVVDRSSSSSSILLHRRYHDVCEPPSLHQYHTLPLSTRVWSRVIWSVRYIDSPHLDDNQLCCKWRYVLTTSSSSAIILWSAGHTAAFLIHVCASILFISGGSIVVNGVQRSDIWFMVAGLLQPTSSCGGL